MTHELDGATLSAFLRGDEHVLSTLVRKHHRELMLFAFRYVRNEADAEEIVQEAFLRLHRTRESFRGDCSLRSWVYRIVTNLCLNHVKKHRRETVTDEPPEVASEPNALQDMLDGEQHQLLAAAFESLPPKQKLTLSLRVHQGLSLQEIAESLDAPLGTVKANLFHAIKSLQKRLAPYFSTDEEGAATSPVPPTKGGQKAPPAKERKNR